MHKLREYFFEQHSCREEVVLSISLRILQNHTTLPSDAIVLIGS